MSYSTSLTRLDDESTFILENLTEWMDMKRAQHGGEREHPSGAVVWRIPLCSIVAFKKLDTFKIMVPSFLSACFPSHVSQPKILSSVCQVPDKNHFETNANLRKRRRMIFCFSVKATNPSCCSIILSQTPRGVTFSKKSESQLKICCTGCQDS